MVTTQKLLNDSIADDTGTGWKVSFDMQYHPWLGAAEDDSRPVLTGVYFDPDGWMVATNGFAVAIMPVQIQPGLLQSEPFPGAVIPAPFVKAAYAAAKKRKDAVVEMAVVGNRARFDVFSGGSWCDLIMGSFPNWRALIPHSVGRATSNGANPELVAKFSDALGGSFLRWLGGPDASSPLVMVGMGGESFALIMPMEVDMTPPLSLLQRARGVQRSSVTEE